MLLGDVQRLSASAQRAWITYLSGTLLAIGLALALAAMIMRSINRQLQDTLTTIAEMGGDLTQRLSVPGTDELSRLNSAYNQSLESIANLVIKIKNSATTIGRASNEIAYGNHNLAQRRSSRRLRWWKPPAAWSKLPPPCSRPPILLHRRAN